MDGQRRRAGDRSWRRRSDRDGDGRGAERLDLGLGLGEAARGAERPRGVGGGRGERMEAGGERMEAGAPLHTRSAAPLGWAGSAPAPPTALLPAWPGERAVGRAWAAVPPIGPIGPAISGRAWTCPWARIEAQARPGYRARAGPSPIIFGPVPCSGRANMGRASGPHGYRAKWPSILSGCLDPDVRNGHGKCKDLRYGRRASASWQSCARW